MRGFEELAGLTDRDLQLVVRKVDARDLAVALGVAEPELRDRIVSNTSPRVSQMVREEMAAARPATATDLEGVRLRIAEAVRRLQDAGEISDTRKRSQIESIPGPGEPEEKPDLGPVRRAQRWERDRIVRTLAAMLRPAPSNVRNVLDVCLPEPLRREISSLLSDLENGEDGEAPPLGEDLRGQAEEVWGEEGQVHEIGKRSLAGILTLADVIALILKGAKPTEISRGVLQLPGVLRAEVLYRIAAVDMAELPRRIKNAGARGFYLELHELLGPLRLGPAPEWAAQAIQPIGARPARRILTDLHRIDPGAMKAVQDIAYPFEDLVQLSDPDLQMVLTGVENADVALALKATPTGVSNRIRQNLSSRRRRMVEAEEARTEDTSATAIQRAKSRIVDRARLLYELGQLRAYFGSIEDTEARNQKWEDVRRAVYDSYTSWVTTKGKDYPQARRQSIGVALSAVCLIAVGVLLFRFLYATGAAHGPVQETGVRWKPEGLAGSPKAPSAPRPSGAIERRGLAEGPETRGGLRLSAPGAGAGAEWTSLAQGPETREEVWLKAGLVRVIVLDSATVLRTPLVRVVGPEGTAYRVEVTPDTTVRLAALRGVLLARHEKGEGGGTRIEGGLEAVFSSSGAMRVGSAAPDSEDQAWLAENP